MAASHPNQVEGPPDDGYCQRKGPIDPLEFLDGVTNIGGRNIGQEEDEILPGILPNQDGKICDRRKANLGE